MPALKVGIQLASLRLPLKKALQVASRLGVDAVEMDARGEISPGQLSDTAIRQLRKMLTDLNLSVCAVGFRTRRGYNVVDDLDRRIDATKRAMEFAYRLGAPVVINQVGRVPEEPQGQDWNLLLESLADLGKHGQHVGAVLAAETGTESGATLGRLIESLPAGSIAVNLDPGNLIINGFSASEAIGELARHVMHVHAKDGVRDLAQGRGIEVTLGRGSADFFEIAGTLEEFGFRGYFTIERESASNVIEEIGMAVEYLRSL